MEINMTLAAKGANLLDEKMPGWYKKIDLKTFVWQNHQKCVIGQLFNIVDDGDFGDALTYLGLNSSGYVREQDKYGFGSVDYFQGKPCENFQKTWIEEINKRLKANK